METTDNDREEIGSLLLITGDNLVIAKHYKMITQTGYQEYFYYHFGNKILHREDGPARIKTNGEEQYYLHAINFKKNEWEKHIERIVEKEQYYLFAGE